ncbi:zinc finger c2h2-type protein [Diplodia corticola]|uniref:Zinc finger c2h2-type protein n=1 Tax=Diplodia corticola TaxID=236234 RepID=A0A1J9S2G8_9PEZI|nr:zinc finger c2h2-type protein [Diplodia corticola]OJD34204.1 zinc finger c2h2-type protein [Diplodia corticola]
MPNALTIQDKTKPDRSESVSPVPSLLTPLSRVGSVDREENDPRAASKSPKRRKIEDIDPDHEPTDACERTSRYIAVDDEHATTTKTSVKSGDPKSKKLACPYYKQNPRKEGRPVACVHPGFSSVARLKEHLYRIHRLPIECPRCQEHFSSEQERTVHLSASQRCTPQPRISNAEGFDKDQELKLRTKKRSKGDGDEEEKWRGVFKILFPDVALDKVPSAYLEPDAALASRERPAQEVKVLDGFESFSSKEIPQVVEKVNRKRLAEQAVTPQLLEFIENCQRELFNQFRHTEVYKNIIGQEVAPESVNWEQPQFQKHLRDLQPWTALSRTQSEEVWHYTYTVCDYRMVCGYAPPKHAQVVSPLLEQESC